MLRATGRPTFVGGNLGEPLAEAVGTPAAGEGGFCVVEVSSFQLETVETFHPRVAVLLNITPDHLDRYDGIDGYAAAKARIFAAQTAGGLRRRQRRRSDRRARGGGGAQSAAADSRSTRAACARAPGWRRAS